MRNPGRPAVAGVALAMTAAAFVTLTGAASAVPPPGGYDVGNGSDGAVSYGSGQTYVDTTTGTWTNGASSVVRPGVIVDGHRVYRFTTFGVSQLYVRGAYGLDLRATSYMSVGTIEASGSHVAFPPLAAGPGPGGGAGGATAAGTRVGADGLGVVPGQGGKGGGARDGATGYGPFPGCGGAGGAIGGAAGTNSPVCGGSSGQGAGGGGGGGAAAGLQAGAGGGAGGSVEVTGNAAAGGYGGHGGGSVRLTAGVHLAVTGIVDVLGEDGGATPVGKIGGGGGGGSGGLLFLGSRSVVVTGLALYALGGAGGFGGHASAGDGGRGADGHIVIASDTATVNAAIHGPVTYDAFSSDSAPAVVNDSYSVGRDDVLTVDAPGVLANDSDADGDALVSWEEDAPLHGDLAFGQDGAFTYTPHPGFSGTDVFTYSVDDGIHYSGNVQVLIRVKALGYPDTTNGGHGVSSFASGATLPTLTGSVLQRDGRLVVVGGGSNGGGDTDFWLARFNADGSRDTAFGTGGNVFTDFLGGPDNPRAATLLQVDADPAHDRIVVVGSAGTNESDIKMAYAVYALDGTLVEKVRDTAQLGASTAESFDEGTTVTAQSPGTLYVGGFANQNAVVRKFTVGAPLGPDFYRLAAVPTSSVTGVARFVNAAGQSTIVMSATGTVDGVTQAIVARFVESTGALDSTFASGAGYRVVGPTRGAVLLDVQPGATFPITVVHSPSSQAYNWDLVSTDEPGTSTAASHARVGSDIRLRGLARDSLAGGLVLFGTRTTAEYFTVRMTPARQVEFLPDTSERWIVGAPLPFTAFAPPAVLPDRRILLPFASGATMKLVRLIGDSTPPGAVSPLAVESRDGAVALSWAAAADPSLRHYRVCVQPGATVAANCVPTTTTTATSVTVPALTNGTAYTVGVRAVDTNGNVGPQATAGVVPQLQTTLVQAPTTAARVAYGGAVAFTATLRNASGTPLAAQSVILEAKRTGTAVYTAIGAALTTNASGVATSSPVPQWGGSYRFRFAGTSNTAGSVSAGRTVTVVGVVTAGFTRGLIRLDTSSLLRGRALPYHSTPVRLDRLGATGWVTVATTVTRADGTYEFTVTPTTSGAFSYRVRFMGDADHASAVSPTRVLKVYDVTIATVRATAPEYVDIVNTGALTVDLKGWKLSDAYYGRSVLLPSFSLAKGKTLRVYVGSGARTTTSIYLGLSGQFLRDSHDTVRLRDPAGTTAYTRVY
jgi:hypothetical protein